MYCQHLLEFMPPELRRFTPLSTPHDLGRIIVALAVSRPILLVVHGSGPLDWCSWKKCGR